MAGDWPVPAADGGAWHRLSRWAGTEPDNGARSRLGRRVIHASITSVLLVAVVSVAVELLDNHAPVRSLSVLYLLAIVPVALLWGTVFATVASLLSVFVFSYLYIPPRRHFDVTEPAEWYALVVFEITAIVVSELAARSQRAARASERLAEQQGALRRVAMLVARETSRRELDTLISEEVGRLLAADLATMRHYEGDGGVRLMGEWERSPGLVAPVCEPAVARVTDVIAQTGKPASVDSETLGASRPGAWPCSAAGVPIIVEGQLWGAMIVAACGHTLPAGAGARLHEFTALVAIAIANAKNRADLAASRERVVIAADETRRRIERNLHDGAQQQILALALEVQATQESLPGDLPHVRAELSRVTDGLIGTLEELREIARGIHPGILAQGGLAPALKMLARRSPVPVELEVELGKESRLAEPIEVAAYYVVAEALTNAAKHANASVIRVSGGASEGMLQLHVQDDGRGGADRARGSGLVGMTDRVEALGGTLVLRSPPGAGTSVVVALPIATRA
jgi:signal transduction histidine kinase